MPEETLETVGDLNDAVAESNEGYIVDGNGDRHDMESSSEIGTAAVEETEKIEMESVSLEEESAPAAELDSVESIQVLAAPRAAFVDLSDLSTCYKVDIDGTEYFAFFQKTEGLEVVDGHLINTGTSTLQALLSSSASVNPDTWQQKYLSVVPLFGSSGNSAAYSNGSRSYVTTYYVGQYDRLNTTTTYVQPEVVKKPKLASDWSPFMLVIAFCLISLLFIDLLGGILRR